MIASCHLRSPRLARLACLACLAVRVALHVAPCDIAFAQSSFPGQQPTGAQPPGLVPADAQPVPSTRPTDIQLAPVPSVTSTPPATLAPLTPPSRVTSPSKAPSTTLPAVKADSAGEGVGTIDSLKRALEPKANGLTEAEVVQAALAHSPAMRKTGLDADKAAANHARAKLAMFPRIDLTARYTKLSEVPVIPQFTQYLNQYASQASVKLPITDLFLVILPTYKATIQLEDVAEHQARAKESGVAYDARLAFYDFARAQGAAVVAADSVRVLEQNVQDLEALATAGAATDTDVLRARARLSGAQVTASQLSGSVEVASMRLSRMVGPEVDLKRGVAEPLADFDAGETPLAGDVVSKAFAQRHELLALHALERAREKQVAARKGAEWPQLNATANGYYSNPNQRIFPQKDEFKGSWDVGLALTFSPNDAAIARTQATDAEMDVEQVAQDVRLLEDAIAVEAAMAVTSHRTARERIRATTQNLEASLRFFDDQQNLMKAGAATPSDVLDAESELRRAQFEWVDAFIGARMANAALIKARGDTGLTRGPRSSR